MQIWKYPLNVGHGAETILLVPRAIPEKPEALHVGLDPVGTPCVWYKVDPTAAKIPIRWVCIGTGHDIPEKVNKGYWHVDSVVDVKSMPPYEFVWHFFESLDD